MPIIVCDSCKKRYKVPQAGKVYRCICGNSLRADSPAIEPEPIEETNKGPTKITDQEEKKPPEAEASPDRGKRIRSRRKPSSKKGNKKKYIFAAILAVLFVVCTVVPYLLMQPSSLQSVAQQFADVWNETGGIEDMEGISRVVDFFMEDIRQKVKGTFIERFPVYKWFKHKPPLGEPIFRHLDEEGKLDDNKYKTYGLFYPITTEDYSMLQAVKWGRNATDQWRIESLIIPPAFREVPQLSYRFKEIWNDEDDTDKIMNRIASFFHDEDRETLAQELMDLVAEKGWQAHLPKLAKPTSGEKAIRKYGISIMLSFSIQDTKEVLWSFWIRQKGRWYVKEIKLSEQE